MNIYVSNLSFKVKDEDLKAFFTPYGEVTSAKVVSDKVTGRSKGFGFVEMPDEAAGKTAIAELDNGAVDGRNIKVIEARPRDDRSKPTAYRSKSNSPFRSDNESKSEDTY